MRIQRGGGERERETPKGSDGPKGGQGNIPSSSSKSSTSKGNKYVRRLLNFDQAIILDDNIEARCVDLQQAWS